MWLRASACDRMPALAWRVCPAALALPLLMLFAAPAAIAETATRAPTATRAELEQRVLDIAHMFQNDPRYNRGKTPQQIKDGVEFVTGNVLFILGHETAHALISEMGIPVLGREEDAADALATIVALKMSNSFADRVVVNAARGWFLSDQRDRKDGVSTTYYDEHGMDLQRAYAIVCLLVGGQPEKFASLANEVKLPKERQDSCQGDYSNASWSWERVLEPHRRKPEDPKTKIEVNYAAPGEFATLAALGRRLQILETVAEWLSEDYVWRRPISLEMQQCGSPGARWDVLTRKIVVCYEVIRDLSQLYRGYGQMALVPGTIKMSKNKKVIVVATPGGGKSRTQKAFRPERTRR